MSNWTKLKAEVRATRVPVAPVAAATASMQYKVPVFDRITDNKVSRTVTEEDAHAMLEALSKEHPLRLVPGDDAKRKKTKAQAPLFGLGVVRADLEPGASMATEAALLGVQLVAFDVDSATSEQITAFDAELARLGWLHLKFSTYNHKPEVPRVRYVLPLSRMAPCADYKPKQWAAVQKVSGKLGDINASDPARRSYFPSRPAEHVGEWPATEIRGSRVVDPDELAAIVAADVQPVLQLAPLATTRPSMGINDDVLDGPKRPENRLRDPALIAAGCSMVNTFRQTGDPDNGHGETLWRASAGIYQHVRDRQKVFHIDSAKDPRYDRDETQRKFDGWTAGPPRCDTIEAAGWKGCATCPHKGRITSPVQLGDSLETLPAKDAKPDALAALKQRVSDGSLRPVVDQDGQVNYIKERERDGRRCRDVYLAGTQDGNDLLLDTVVRGGGKPPTQQQIDAFEASQRIAAKESGQVEPVALRVAERGGTFFHDLGPGRIARIGPDGWTVTDETDTTIFRRGAAAGELPMPDFAGTKKDALRHLMGEYSEQFNLDGARALVASVLTLDALNPNSTHPVREYVGPGGSGKTTMADHDIRLIDPGENGRRTTGTKGDDIAASAQQQYCLMVDNAGRMDPATQNLLCVVSTGGTVTARRLYAQRDTIAMNLHRPMHITAVSPVCTQADLMTRTARFEFQPRPEGTYVGEEEMRERMDARRPRTLGAMYTLLSGALAALPTVRQRKDWPHRLVSFDQLGEAVVLAAGLKPGTFLAAVGKMRAGMARRTASGDVFTIALLAALRELATNPTDETQPSLSSILKRSRALSVLAYDSDRVEITARPNVMRETMPRPSAFERDGAMPGTDRAFLDAVRRVQPMLGSMGVSCTEVSCGSRTFIRFDASTGALNEE